MENRSSDLRYYWRILLRWGWILAVGVVSAVVGGYLLTKSITPIYDATVKVQVQGRQTPGLPSASDIEASQRIARDYGELIKMRPILERVVLEASLPYGPEILSSKIVVSSSRSIIEIKAKDPDPEQAAVLSNTTAQIFIDDFRNRQFTQIAGFMASLNQYGISEDPTIVATQFSTLSSLSVVEEAIPAASASSPRLMFNLFISAVLGLLVSGLIVFLLEYLDDSIGSPDELKALTGLPGLGSVMRYGASSSGPITLADEHIHSPLAESYKFLQTSLEFASLGNDNLRSILITSSSPAEGKTTTAANLAISLAREGRSVILVDTDLRKPAMQRVFDITGAKGLTHLILGNATVDEVLAPTGVEGLRVVPTGPLPPDVTHLLRSARMRQVIGELKASADLVIFDSPPLLSVTDPMLIVGQVDAVLLVVDAHRTGKETVKRGAETLLQAQPSVAGTVLNKVTTKSGGYYYHYYRYYSSENGSKGRNGRRFLSLPKLFRRGGEAKRYGRGDAYGDRKSSSDS